VTAVVIAFNAMLLILITEA